MIRVQIDLTGEFTGQIGSIIGYGQILGTEEQGVYSNVPQDFTFEKYEYEPNEDGSFNPDGFTRIENFNDIIF
jgi:hypothetical protein